MKISVSVITLNEEVNLQRCLKSCADLADEIVVLDSGSRDGTEQVARKFGAQWHVEQWRGYVAQKNRALALAQNEWILSIDADEELSEVLQSELRMLRTGEPPETVAGYSMPRCVFYEGKWIRHGDWYPDRLVRLFRRSAGRFAGGKVHERLELTGHVARLRGELHHYSFRDAADHWARCRKYASLWAETQRELGGTSGPLAPWSHAAARWLRAYVFKFGWLDGAAGLQIANYSAAEVFLKYQLLRKSSSRTGKS